MSLGAWIPAAGAAVDWGALAVSLACLRSHFKRNDAPSYLISLFVSCCRGFWEKTSECQWSDGEKCVLEKHTGRQDSGASQWRGDRPALRIWKFPLYIQSNFLEKSILRARKTVVFPSLISYVSWTGGTRMTWHPCLFTRGGHPGVLIYEQAPLL